MMLIRRPTAKITATTMPAVERPEPELDGGLLVGFESELDWAGEREG